MPRVISRAKAKARKLKRYFTGKPCIYGHVAERWTCNCGCIICCHAALKRWHQSPKGQERDWRWKRTPKGRERMRRYNQSPKGQDYQWQWKRTPKGQEHHRREEQKWIASGKSATWQRKRRLERTEAAYNASPTVANWNRLQNLIVRRIRNGR